MSHLNHFWTVWASGFVSTVICFTLQSANVIEKTIEKRFLIILWPNMILEMRQMAKLSHISIEDKALISAIYVVNEICKNSWWFSWNTLINIGITGCSWRHISETVHRYNILSKCDFWLLSEYTFAFFDIWNIMVGREICKNRYSILFALKFSNSYIRTEEFSRFAVVLCKLSNRHTLILCNKLSKYIPL